MHDLCGRAFVGQVGQRHSEAGGVRVVMLGVGATASAAPHASARLNPAAGNSRVRKRNGHKRDAREIARGVVADRLAAASCQN